ncbi:MAG: EamA family transporter [Myxococcota bacterium]
MWKERGYWLVVAATFAFALMAVFTRSADAPILTVAAWRAVLVAVVFGVWAVVEGGGPQALKPEKPVLRLGAWYGLTLAVASSTYVGGFALTTVANTVFFHSLSPLAVFPLAWWLFREQPTSRQLAGTAISVLGLALLSGVSLFHFTNFTDPRFLLGDFLAFVSAIGYGGSIVATRAARREGVPIVQTLFVAWVVAAAVLIVVAAAFGSLALPLGALGWVVALAVVSTVVPFYLLNLAMRTVPAGVTSLLAMSEVVFATAIGVFLYGESIAPIGWVGGALVIAGIVHPFVGGDDAGDAAPGLSEETQKVRGGRLALRLVMLNAGALLLVLEGAEAGAMLVWIALGSVVRIGPPLALDFVGAARAKLLQAAAALIGVGVLVGLAMRGGWADPAPPLFAAGLAVAIWFADRWLSAMEAPGEADTDPFTGGALLLFAAGVALTGVHHAAGTWLSLAAALAVALGAAGAIGGMVRGGVGQKLDAVPGLLARPKVALPLAVVLLLLGGVRAVPAGHVGVVERLGEPLAAPVEPGLAIRMPPPIETITLVDVASVRQTSVLTGDTPLLTGDQSLVALDVTLYWTVADPLDFALHVEDPGASVATFARAALAETVARLRQDEVLTTGRRAVEQQVMRVTQGYSDAAGIGTRVIDVHLSTVAVPAPVLTSFLDVISAEERKRERVNQAEAYAAQVVPKARGQAEATIERAKGEAARRIAEAEGAAQWVLGVSEGGRSAARLNRVRVWREQVSEALAERKLVLVPRSVKLWLGGVLPVERRGTPSPGGK